MEVSVAKDWLRSNGFDEGSEGVFKAPYGNAYVCVELRNGRLKTSLNQDANADRPFRQDVIIDGNDDLLHADIDRNGMLQGIGIYSGFVGLYKQTGVKPLWFTDSLVAELQAMWGKAGLIVK
jgi:hypothetical protein